MHGRRQRRDERRATAVRAHELLEPEELGRIMATALGASVIGSVLELVLLVLTVRTAVDAWRRRAAGFRVVVRTARVPRMLAFLGVLVVNRLGLRALLFGWLRRSVRRAETRAPERP